MTTALELPPISTALLREVESRSYALGLRRDHLLEAAARSAASLARRLLENQFDGTPIVALVGTGLKAAVALHALRILQGYGAECSAILTSGEREMLPETLAAAQLADALHLRLLQPRSPLVRAALAEAEVVIDGLVGVGLDGPPREPMAMLIRLCNEIRAEVLSLELPCGLHPDSGQPSQPTITARATLALGLPAQGLFSSLAWQFTGQLWLCDVGFPLDALDANELDGEGLFSESELVRIR